MWDAWSWRHGSHPDPNQDPDPSPPAAQAAVGAPLPSVAAAVVGFVLHVGITRRAVLRIRDGALAVASTPGAASVDPETIVGIVEIIVGGGGMAQQKHKTKHALTHKNTQKKEGFPTTRATTLCRTGVGLGGGEEGGLFTLENLEQR